VYTVYILKRTGRNREMKNMRKNETIQAGNFIIKKIGKDEYRLVEIFGDWIMSGSEKQIKERIAK